jgi:pimeloyl-ACP methyl ester carboxylesterase
MTNSTSMHESDKAEKGSYVAVNDLNMYYEIHGSGEPLVMLHGAFGTVDMYGELLPLLAQTRQVIAVELRAHGHSGDIDRPLRYELMADDIAALIKHLELEHADLFGYSLGGGVALQTVIRHPEMVRKLVVVSAPCRRDGWYPEVLAGQAAISAELFAGSPI